MFYRYEIGNLLGIPSNLPNYEALLTAKVKNLPIAEEDADEPLLNLYFFSKAKHRDYTEGMAHTEEISQTCDLKMDVSKASFVLSLIVFPVGQCKINNP